MKNALQLFKIVGYAEGTSFLVLLAIAMPMKYIFDIPVAVLIAGSIHGALFILYVLLVVYLKFTRNWSILKAFLALVASVLPFGPFVFDAKLIRNEQVNM